jgi:TetR/AcrR family transcriptional regulator, repressor for uid operon
MRLAAAERREQILMAATAIFARRGFHAAAMDEIAREAGISPGLIYRHFSSKDDLVVALVEEYERGELATLAEARARPTLAAALERFFAAEGPVEEWRTTAAVTVEVIAEALRNRRIAAVVEESDAQIASGLADLIAEAQARGQADPGLDPRAAAELLIALADGLLLRLVLANEPAPQTVAAITDTLHLLLARFLAPPGP